MHDAYLEVGFVEDGVPGNYSEIWSNSYDEAAPFKEAWYLRVARELCKRMP